MSETDAPKIEFPCEYPVKVLGRSHEDFRPMVMDVFGRHAPGYNDASTEVRPSRNGTFTSLTVFITATGKEQLEALHADLMDIEHVKMVM
ncbi:MAG: DUF493 domain-containing protein [Halieaceae bacterium]|nr:DUF493 domain-containing protein [Halieaceae bacterium]MCP4465864.1 DUF493 domain-containing protein [Halieaceae bacterium]MCP4842533.1 DUF493 domain-containing protein [Halieaceae bacterium]MDG2411969.1 DUF493 domain-containing protein [Halioglobus sp.]